VGDNREINIDVRIIAATHKDLLEETRRGLFREDLYYRINVFTIRIPPLRERIEDIPLLIEYFLKNSSADVAKTRISREAMKALLQYPFPGNVRELENIIERALILCEDHIIKIGDLPPEMVDLPQNRLQKSEPLEEGLRQVISRNRELAEKDIIVKALKEAGSNKTLAAKILKIGRTSLYRKLKKLNLEA
jgi:DNA-binding NtrC family response regulator